MTKGEKGQAEAERPEDDPQDPDDLDMILHAAPPVHFIIRKSEEKGYPDAIPSLEA